MMYSRSCWSSRLRLCRGGLSRRRRLRRWCRQHGHPLRDWRNNWGRRPRWRFHGLRRRCRRRGRRRGCDVLCLKRAEGIGDRLVEHERQVVAVLRRLDSVGRGPRQIDADLRHQRRLRIESDTYALDRILADVRRLRHRRRHVRKVHDDATRSVFRLGDTGRNQAGCSEQADRCGIATLLHADVANRR